MELINPFGRNLNDSIQPRACYCASDGGSAADNFVDGKGSDSLSLIHISLLAALISGFKKTLNLHTA